MICRYCGHRMVNDSGFCTKCGHPIDRYGQLGEKVPPKAKMPKYVPSVKKIHTSENNAPDQNNTGNVNAVTMIIVIVCIVAVLCVGLVLLRFFDVI